MLLNNLENKLKELNKEVGSLEGQRDLLLSSIDDNQDKVNRLKIAKEQHLKAVEILNLVQKTTRDNIKESFEIVVTHALRYIYSDDYSFELDFNRRGNLGTMDFNIKTPEFTESASPEDTSGGGVLDICALALRMVLLEVSTPKVEGCIILDESLKHLSKDYLYRASQFLNEINKKLGRQIIFITHQQEFIDNAEHSIEIGG